jgi:threonine/homoserine/homoserine lactone efflux protein
MPESTTLLAFVAAALLVLVIPGPGFLYILARSLAQGRLAGLVSAVGLVAGTLVQVGAAAAGLSALLMASATAFGIVKALGAGYLIYLGLRALFARQPSAGVEAAPPCSMFRVFIDGIVVSIFNPKIAIFFLAFLPQFVDPSQGPVPQQFLLLGLIFVVLALIIDGAFALLAGSLQHRLGGRVMKGPVSRYATGIVYIGLGVTTALVERRI